MNKLQHKNCVYELNNYFFKNRLKTRLQHDLCLCNLFGRYYYKYILARIRKFGDCIPNDNLQHLHITNNKIKLIPLVRQHQLIQ